MGSAFLIKVLALIILAIFFSYYKDWYPKPVVERETLYIPLENIINNNKPLNGVS